MIAKLEEVCILQKGNTGIQKAKPGEYPLVVTAEERLTSNEYQFDCEAVCIPLVSSTGHGHASLKRIHYQKGKFALGNILCAVIPKNNQDLLAEYLYVYLMVYKDELLVPLMKGAANVAMTVNSLKGVEIKIPTVEQQKRIIAEYNSITSKIEEINNTNTRSFEYIDKLEEKILYKAFNKKLLKNDDETWISAKMSDCLDLCTGNSISQNIKKSKYTNIKDGYNYIATKDLEFDHSFQYENGVKIPFNEQGFKYAEPEDILLCIEGGSAGRKVGILNEKVCYGNKLCKFSTNKDEILPKFLFYFLMSPQFQKNFKDQVSGIIGGVSISKIKEIIIEFPTINKQTEIVEKIERNLDFIKQLREKIYENKNDISNILKSYIYNLV